MDGIFLSQSVNQKKQKGSDGKVSLWLSHCYSPPPEWTGQNKSELLLYRENVPNPKSDSSPSQEVRKWKVIPTTNGRQTWETQRSTDQDSLWLPGSTGPVLSASQASAPRKPDTS